VVKLVDLNPKFLDAHGEPKRTGVGVEIDCPCGCGDPLYVPFAQPLDGGPAVSRQGWERTGDTFQTLTLKPSILRSHPGSCGWHGYITSGEVMSC
jgi:hypothetical protein